MEEKTYVDDIDRSIYDIKNDEKDVYRIQEGLTPEIVTEISRKKKDPSWMEIFRLQSLQIYNRMKEPDFFRPLDGKVKRDFMKVSLGEIVSAVRCAAESNLPLELEELVKEVIALFGLPRKTKQVSDRIERAVAAAV